MTIVASILTHTSPIVRHFFELLQRIFFVNMQFVSVGNGCLLKNKYLLRHAARNAQPWICEIGHF